MPHHGCTTAQTLMLDPNVLVDINTFYGIFDDNILVRMVAAVEGEIYNVVSTSIGEENFEPTYGGVILPRLFDPIDEVTAHFLRNDLRRAIELWVPQLRIDMARTTATPKPDERLFDLTIAYELVGFGFTSAYHIQIGPYVS